MEKSQNHTKKEGIMEMNASYIVSTILGIMLMGAWAEAQETWLVGGTPVSKVEALKAKILDRGADVVRCQPQELTEKLTLKAKKK